MKKVLLNVVGTQTADGDSDKIELTTVGTLDDDDKNYYIEYDETDDDSKTVHVNIVINKALNTVKTERSGAYSSSLIIKKGKRNQCHYSTPYGEILMGINGKNIIAEINENNGKFIFTYTIDINGSEASKNEVNIKFRITAN